MFMLEIKDPSSKPEVFHFLGVERALDYIYMVEGESLLPELRGEYQRRSPGQSDIMAIRENKGSHFFLWVVGDIRYYLSYVPSSQIIARNSGGPKHVKYCAAPASRFYGTVYGVVPVSGPSRSNGGF